MPAAVGAALRRAARSSAPTTGRRCSRACSRTPRYLHRGLHELGFQVVEPQPLPDGSTVVTPIVPVVVGDDWKAVLLWRALYDAGVFVNVALHPAVPPAGALLRTSVMATHERATLDSALERFASVKPPSRPSTARCPLPDRALRRYPGVSTFFALARLSGHSLSSAPGASSTNHPLFANDPIRRALIRGAASV